MIHFRPDNTQGYTATELAELNQAFQAVCAVRAMPSYSGETSLFDHLDHLAENLLASYDAGLRGEALITAASQ